METRLWSRLRGVTVGFRLSPSGAECFFIHGGSVIQSKSDVSSSDEQPYSKDNLNKYASPRYKGCQGRNVWFNRALHVAVVDDDALRVGRVIQMGHSSSPSRLSYPFTQVPFLLGALTEEEIGSGVCPLRLPSIRAGAVRGVDSDEKLPQKVCTHRGGVQDSWEPQFLKKRVMD